jgi:5'-nucleotidase
MLKFPKKLSEARILISNDDGIHSDGIKVLEDIARSLSPNVWVVAPENQQSGVGHSLTMNMPLRVREYDSRHYSVYGTPTDSALLGGSMVMKKSRPHVVFSGINHGQNTADDVTYSGTIAACIEATLMGVPSIAFSQDYDENGGKPDWTIAREYLPRLLKMLEGAEWDKNVLLSVNLPKRKAGVIPEIRIVPQGHYSMEKPEMVSRVDPSGRPYYWLGPPPARDELDQSMDVGSLKAGHITVTPLSLNLTHHPTLKTLKGVFK